MDDTDGTYACTILLAYVCACVCCEINIRQTAIKCRVFTKITFLQSIPTSSSIGLNEF